MTRTRGAFSSGDFVAESHMAAPVCRWLSRRKLTVLPEVVSPTGICDLLAFRFRAAGIHRRTSARQRQPVASRPAVTVYSMLPDADVAGTGASLLNLRRRLRRRGSTLLADDLEKILSRLERQNHAHRADDGSWSKRNGWWPLHARLIAVELKLNQPTRVCEQAANNRRFAAESYAALPADAVARMRDVTVEKFRKAGVGLLAVTRRTCTKVVAPHRADSAFASDQMLMVERLWRDHRGKISADSSSATRAG